MIYVALSIICITVSNIITTVRSKYIIKTNDTFTHFDDNAGIITLTSDNYDALTTASNQIVLVEYYVPWEGKHHLLEHELVRTAYELKAHNIDINVAQIDLSIHTDIEQRVAYDQYPSLIVFYKGMNIGFKRERTFNDIYAYLTTNVIYGNSISVNNMKQLVKTTLQYNRALISTIHPSFAVAYDNFHKFCLKYFLIQCIQCYTSECVSKFNNNNNNSVVLYRSFATPIKLLHAATRDITYDELCSFVFEYAIEKGGVMDAFGRQVALKSMLPCVFLFNNKPTANAHVEAVFKEVASGFGSEILFYNVDINDSEVFLSMLAFFRISLFDVPCIYIINFVDGRFDKFKKYRLNISKFESLTYDTLYTFVSSFMNKQLELTRGNVVKNVFEIKESDFYNVVMQSKENYFVLFYGDLCYFDKQCQQLYTVMNELHIEYINKVNFAAFNYMNTNVISFESEVALPSVLAFMKGKKQMPFVYLGELRKGSIEQWALKLTNMMMISPTEDNADNADDDDDDSKSSDL